ncbi:MAG: DUF883 family protein [Candidatus Nitrotoga sp.]|nr:DUF883 family protein [Candidatus Nitrotoga sp.]MDO9446891.1 DUF883 family protein [Candidatus Nitrotoga sp.]MDP1637868.1 DUF883 family protein [Candidatus Nitrotoga sp.]MDP1855018.1 DUF883 family protein [Candidatus Nitrotoga sp.]MDP3497209.1 DUF883 family protein [Candidatus Nitrotoga sp.]
MTQFSSQTIKNDLLKDFNTVVHEGEQLLKSVVDEGGDKANALRAKMESNLKAAKERLRQIEENAIETTKTAARATDNYVHENPWRVIAISAGIGVVIGLLLNRH